MTLATKVAGDYLTGLTLMPRSGLCRVRGFGSGGDPG
jgi:hypothetical protein